MARPIHLVVAGVMLATTVGLARPAAACLYDLPTPMNGRYSFDGRVVPRNVVLRGSPIDVEAFPTFLLRPSSDELEALSFATDPPQLVPATPLSIGEHVVLVFEGDVDPSAVSPDEVSSARRLVFTVIDEEDSAPPAAVEATAERFTQWAGENSCITRTQDWVVISVDAPPDAASITGERVGRSESFLVEEGGLTHITFVDENESASGEYTVFVEDLAGNISPPTVVAVVPRGCGCSASPLGDPALTLFAMSLFALSRFRSRARRRAPWCVATR